MRTRSDPLLPTALLSIVAAVTLAACGEAPHPPNAGGNGAPQVAVTTVQTQRLALTTELPGRVTAALVAEVRPQVGGLVQERHFKEGSQVKAGDLLYQIDPATFRASVDNAQASLDKAEATLVTARLKAGRYKELAVMKAVSQQDADDADASLLQAQADVNAARATLQTQRINLAYTRITAPISGRIGRSSVTPGALVTSNQATVMATVQQLDPIYVDVTQSSGAMLALKRSLEKGQLKGGTAAVKLVLDDGTVYPLAGKLQFSEVTVDPATSAVTLRAEFPNPKGDLLPGMYAKAVIEEGVIDQAVLVPQPAVTRDSTGKAIAYVVDGGGKLAQRTLKADRAIGDQWLVSSGLQAGDRLVVEGQQKARPGQAVEVKSETTGAAIKTVAASASGNTH
ncbi:efflux RND transporter periplasmic adaptor subunit [Roseateles sp. SL47]|uniref:efflux RND transporter periplasmic adaptor subunit n=1 Tax=Roseateles sp. SL47 TaxID=2995138 RepID=UPI00226F5F56|nr:efflux RND transporter periplasmic adaptor subunit [Roseateles sp. SL47]WAC75391.1 efflux RND transporter periplasmic adaptor subunit [Roseateles sp. SL47]